MITLSYLRLLKSGQNQFIFICKCQYCISKFFLYHSSLLNNILLLSKKIKSYISKFDFILTSTRYIVCAREDHSESLHKWQVYVTGHSLGGALATLLALELSSNQLAK